MTRCDRETRQSSGQRQKLKTIFPHTVATHHIRLLCRFFSKDVHNIAIYSIPNNCKRLMQTQDRQVKGITDIIFTTGKKETKAFAS